VRGARSRRARRVGSAALVGLAAYAAVRAARREELDASAPAAPVERVEPPAEAPAARPPRRRRQIAAAAVGAVVFGGTGLAMGAGTLSSSVADPGLGPAPARFTSPLPAFFAPPAPPPPAQRRLLLRTRPTRRPRLARSPLFAVRLPLSQRVFERLEEGAGRREADWSLVLAYLHASGGAWVSPRRLARLEEIFSQLRNRALRRVAVHALTGNRDTVARTLALARYYRAVGPAGLVAGLGATAAELGRRVLADRRVVLYPAGRADIAAGRVDVRVLATIEYLAVSYGRVVVSCLVSGHRRFARPHVVSAHVYGRAVDIVALRSARIAGHQERGGITDRAVRDLLLLPREARPKQIISLLDRGGESFALEDHDDHIHIGF
jgi:hypothetical protein